MCNMAAEKTLMKLGFVKDEDNAKLNETFKDNIKFGIIAASFFPIVLIIVIIFNVLIKRTEVAN